MDETGLVHFIKIVSFYVGLAGLLLGIDALLGGKVITVLNNILSKSIDLDKMIISNARLRRYLGIVFLTISVLMLLLVRI